MIASSLSPIALFCFNRPNHTELTLNALLNNPESKYSTIYIFCDGPQKKSDVKKVKKVISIIEEIDGFKEKHIRTTTINKGLAESIINGMQLIFKKHDSAIIVEDDIVTHNKFLKYMNLALNYYRDVDNVISISGYNHPKSLMNIDDCDLTTNFFFLPRPSSWGWGTWANRWMAVDWKVSDFNKLKNNKILQKKFNTGGDDMFDMLSKQMEGKIDSWAIRWSYHAFKNELLTLFSKHSLVNNIGMDGTGVHSGKNDHHQNNLDYEISNFKFPEKIIVNECVLHKFQQIYKKNWKRYLKNIIRNFK